MSDDAIIRRIEKFERTVATCSCIVPFLFSAQCFFAAIATPIFEAMFADFGSKLPALTEFVIKSWPMWAGIAVAVPIAAAIAARKADSRASLILSTASGMLMFVAAQVITAALFLPILQLGAVAAGIKCGRRARSKPTLRSVTLRARLCNRAFIPLVGRRSG